MMRMFTEELDFTILLYGLMAAMVLLLIFTAYILIAMVIDWFKK